MAVFAAKITGRSLSIQPGEAIEMRFFISIDLPADMLAGHRWLFLDTMGGVCGATWAHESEWNYPRS